jgi:tetratricopeptide (TPR) repeat protein
MTIATTGTARRKAVWGCIVAAALLAMPAVRAQSNALESALAMYAAAAYDDALKVLDDLRANGRSEDTARIEYYRALCLLAVGQTSDAETAIETAVAAAPFAQPAEVDASPHVRAQFREVRRRVLPRVIERIYADARAAFDRKESAAADKFREVVALIDEPDIQDIAGGPALSQTRALAADYLALSVQRQPDR